MYANRERFRKITGFPVSEISDEEVQGIADLADRAVMRIAAVEVYNEKLAGNINGSNAIYTTANKPIADRNFDRQVDPSDVNVFLAAKDAENNPISTETAVSSVSSRDGRIVLSTAPTTTNAELGVFADYRYYRNAKIDFDIMEEASCYYLAFLVCGKLNDRMVNWRGISDSILSKLVGGGALGAGKEKIVGKKWLDLCLRTLGSMRARGSGKIANKRVKMSAYKRD